MNIAIESKAQHANSLKKFIRIVWVQILYSPIATPLCDRKTKTILRETLNTPVSFAENDSPRALRLLRAQIRIHIARFATILFSPYWIFVARTFPNSVRRNCAHTKTCNVCRPQRICSWRPDTPQQRNQQRDRAVRVFVFDACDVLLCEFFASAVSTDEVWSSTIQRVLHKQIQIHAHTRISITCAAKIQKQIKHTCVYNSHNFSGSTHFWRSANKYYKYYAKHTAHVCLLSCAYFKLWLTKLVLGDFSRFAVLRVCAYWNEWNTQMNVNPSRVNESNTCYVLCVFRIWSAVLCVFRVWTYDVTMDVVQISQSTPFHHRFHLRSCVLCILYYACLLIENCGVDCTSAWILMTIDDHHSIGSCRSLSSSSSSAHPNTCVLVHSSLCCSFTFALAICVNCSRWLTHIALTRCFYAHQWMTVCNDAIVEHTLAPIIIIINFAIVGQRNQYWPRFGFGAADVTNTRRHNYTNSLYECEYVRKCRRAKCANIANNKQPHRNASRCGSHTECTTLSRKYRRRTDDNRLAERVKREISRSNTFARVRFGPRTVRVCCGPRMFRAKI